MTLTLTNEIINGLGSIGTPSAELRNCCRCGSDFQGYGRELACPDCRKTEASLRLTNREKQIIDLVRQAKPNREIASELHLSTATVKEYVSRIFRKLEIKSRTELAVWSIRSAVE